MWGVGEAALTVLGTGTEAQRAEARDVLARSRRDLFRILAEDTAWTDDPATTDQPDPDNEEAGPAEQPESSTEATPAEASADEAPATDQDLAAKDEPGTPEGDPRAEPSCRRT